MFRRLLEKFSLFWRKQRFWRTWLRYAGSRPVRVAGLLLAAALAGYAFYLDVIIREAFEGKRFAWPSRVYARALELYPGAKLSRAAFARELARLNYRESPALREPGTFRRTPAGYEFVARPFTFWDGAQPERALALEFTDGEHERVRTLVDLHDGTPLPLVRLEPPLIGGIYPGHNEDRLLVKLDQVPQHLIDALIAIEDRKFYTHRGVDPRGIARALLATLSGKGVQGGSTITQQLVRNFFLSAERTLWRKFTEMIMALLLEIHYDKRDILETYLNEVYLAQDANRAIHGFGLASHFFFDKPVEQLALHEAALLVGMVKGPVYYDPRRYPERARARRDLVMQEMARLGFITQETFVAAKAQPLGIVAKPPRGTSPYPAFLDLVHRQLRRDYREEDLRSEGLRIFTTLDPEVQRAAEQALARRLAALEKARRLPPGRLEGAVVVTHTQTGEVQAVVGGREARFAGFNRALDARRPIGSLVKPVVYLTALESPERYTLATLLDDSPLRWRERGSEDWQPTNYDETFHGAVPLYRALAHSYNVATARLGLELGVRRVLARMEALGAGRRLNGYAASLLGVNELAPIEVAQIYQTIADGGFRTPLRAIREIVTADGRPLQRYPLTVEQVAAPAPVYLLTVAMQAVVREGTGRGLAAYLPPELGIAGKTGTTDGRRDSWFAGFSGDRVAVVWVGRDDNEPSGLTGGSGALTVFGELLAALDPEPLRLPEPENIEWVRIDPASGRRLEDGCQAPAAAVAEATIELPFIQGSAPSQTAPCEGTSKPRGWLRRLFE